MKTTLAAVAVCLILAPNPAPSHQKGADANQRKSQSEKQIPQPSPASGTQENPAKGTPDNQSTTIASNPNDRTVRIVGFPPRSAGDTIALACTIILTVVGIGGIIAAVCTIRAINKQTKASVNSQRAWIMVDLEKTPGMGGLFEATSRSGDGPEHHSRRFNVRCICSNQGQTAARIIEKRCAMIVVTGDDELPASPNLNIENRDPIPHYLKANGDPWHGDWYLETDVTESPHVQVFVIYGVVRYQHMFSDKIAQTAFGYRLSFDGKLERLIGCPKYNENT